MRMCIYVYACILTMEARVQASEAREVAIGRLLEASQSLLSMPALADPRDMSVY